MQTPGQTMQVLVTVRRLCGFLSISRTTLWRLTKTPDFPKPVRLGSRSIRFDLREVLAWMQSRKTR